MDATKEVLKYLKTDRSLMGGRNLYNKLPRKSLALQSSFSKMNDTEVNRSRMHYELAKCGGIDERQLTILLQQPLKKALEDIEVVSKEVKPPVNLSPEDKLLAFDADKSDYFEAKALAKELELKPNGRKKEDIYSAIAEARAILIEKQVSELPIEVKASIKLRDQFPFLREATCPDALKILVNALITSYETFKKNQPRLHDLLPEADAKTLVDVVLENYINNKEAWAELEHYKETGNVLGEHPLFERLAQKDEISKLPTPELTKKIKNLEINIGKNKKKENAELVDRDTELLAHAQEVLAKR